MKSTPARPGDYLEFFAETDLLGFYLLVLRRLWLWTFIRCCKMLSLKVTIWKVDKKYLDGVNFSKYLIITKITALLIKWVKAILLILHKPQLSENIGACARAIKNFSFRKLILINPKPFFPNDKILATSVGAKDIIDQSKVYRDIEQAFKNIDVVIATSARFRNKNIKHINLNDLKKINFKKRVGFLFGSEASGLSNNEISYANYTYRYQQILNLNL